MFRIFFQINTPTTLINEFHIAYLEIFETYLKMKFLKILKVNFSGNYGTISEKIFEVHFKKMY